jgi:hypothetical protein
MRLNTPRVTSGLVMAFSHRNTKSPVAARASSAPLRPPTAWNRSAPKSHPRFCASTYAIKWLPEPNLDIANRHASGEVSAVSGEWAPTCTPHCSGLATNSPTIFSLEGSSWLTLARSAARLHLLANARQRQQHTQI